MVTITSNSHRSSSSVVVSGAIELLVHACSSQDRAIRLAGQENLHKLVKVRRTLCSSFPCDWLNLRSCRPPTFLASSRISSMSSRKSVVHSPVVSLPSLSLSLPRMAVRGRSVWLWRCLLPCSLAPDPPDGSPSPNPSCQCYCDWSPEKRRPCTRVCKRPSPSFSRPSHPFSPPEASRCALSSPTGLVDSTGADAHDGYDGEDAG